MCSGLCLRGRVPLPADMTPHANKHLKLQIRKLDAIASWHSRKWPFRAQIRGFAKVNTQSNTEGDVLKMPPAEHTPAVPRLVGADFGTFAPGWNILLYLQWAAQPSLYDLHLQLNVVYLNHHVP